ncbi:DUF3995 domain-containing protein [Kitasatospora purpeofusca]|uniref:DUF3995 domain-containing protein n=1 Tax=Kitasatospora purpeofusca TaxID=67352 RepID=UPI00224C8C7E|nr:DUF3995 domain-containing protein [Kitasatospora purpeofusca]MCX4756968.1 DUF3995 domain-containing protein [Kitasatospora purpeofusca]WSR35264.1 DUF3995 domain-containing protein [Kitasatospora purpeofusca]
MSIKSGTGTRWGYAVAVWGVLFAIPSLLWAMGSTFGARSTVAPELVRLAQDRVPWFLAVLWVTGFLKLVGAAIGLGLTRPRGRLAGRSLVFCGGGAAVLLIWHGGLFVLHGILVETGAAAVDPDLAGLTRWYLYLWGPWFLAGGLAFAAATAPHLRPVGRRFAATGALGALLLSLASTATGLG